MTETQKETFTEWKTEVDNRVFSRTGIHTDNMVDMDYMSNYESGTTPLEMEQKLLETEKVFNLI